MTEVDADADADADVELEEVVVVAAATEPVVEVLPEEELDAVEDAADELDELHTT